MQAEDLAPLVDLSLATFHRHFKAVPAGNPLAFHRHIRLPNAQRLIISGDTSATATAFALGYFGAAQASRE